MTSLWNRLLSDAVPRIAGSVEQGILDPTAMARRALATDAARLANAGAADQLAHADFGRSIQAGNLGAKLGQLQLGTARFGENQRQFDETIRQKGLQRDFETDQLRRRALAANSAEALFAAEGGQAPGQALAVGNQARAGRAGREAGARASADTSVRTADATRRGLMQRIAEIKMAAAQQGQPITDWEAISQAKAEIGPGLYKREGNQLTPEQRQQQQVFNMFGRVASGGAQMGQKPAESIAEFTGDAELGNQYGARLGQIARGALGIQEAAPAPDPNQLSEDDQITLDAIAQEFGDDRRTWDVAGLVSEDPSLGELFRKIGMIK